MQTVLPYANLLFTGTVITLLVTLAALPIGIALGLLGAGAKLSGDPVAMAYGNVYTSIVRGIPEFLVILIFATGSQFAVNALAEALGYEGHIDVNPFVAGVVSGIEDIASRHGFSVFLANSNADPEQEIRVVQSFDERRVDGIVVTSSRVGALYVPVLSRRRVPIVLLNNQHPSEFAYSVVIDSTQGSRDATNHLIDLGHRRIAYLGDQFGHQSDTERLCGYREALNQAGLRYSREFIVYGDGKAEGAIPAMSRLLALPRRPTAVVCYNDMSALGAMHQIRAAGLRVPDDLSITGFDDLHISQYLNPPLTTIRQPMPEMGRMAMEKLIALLSGNTSQQNILVPGSLVVRGSTAPPKEIA